MNSVMNGEELIKIFVSVPMKGRKLSTIKAVRTKAVKDAKKILGTGDVAVLNNLLENHGQHKKLWCLGESIKLMDKADYVYFCKGWENYDGCCVEHFIAKKYGLEIIKD